MVPNISFENNIILLRTSLENFALSFKLSNAETKDLVQETVMRALMYKRMFKLGTNMKAWLFTIMKNTFVNSYRKQKSQQNVSYDIIDTNLINKLSSKLDSESNCSLAEIESKINKLGKELREPFIMYTNGYKYQEIADILNIKIGTVKSRIFFARQNLMLSLKDYMQEQ